MDVDKLKSIPDDFKKFDNVVDIDVAKKVLHNKFVSKIAGLKARVPSACKFIYKLQYNVDK